MLLACLICFTGQAQAGDARQGLDPAGLPFGADLIEPAVRADGRGRHVRARIQRWNIKYQMVQVDEPADLVRAQRGAGTARAKVADHLIVRLQPGVDGRRLQELVVGQGMQVRKRLGRSDRFLVSFPVHDLGSQDQARQALARLPEIASIGDDWIIRLAATPDDADFGELWGMCNTGQHGGTAGADIRATQAWDIGTGSRNVVVGVIDTGIDYNHPDLAANMWVNPGEDGTDTLGRNKRTNGVDDDGNGFVDDWRGWDFVNNDNDPMDDQEHGTHCAGTIGGVGNNGQGVAGVCWQVSLVGLKFLDGSGRGWTSDAIESVLYAANMPFTLTSNSWGGGEFSQELKDAIDLAGSRGQLFVAAAGNSSTDNDESPIYPSNYACDNIIAVAATDPNDEMAPFSCYGATTVDLGAPGINVYSCQPGGLYQQLSGTSMAAPHVAGACALLKSVNPSLTGTLIKQAIMANADPIPALAGRCVTGARLNLFAAVTVIAGPVVALEQQVAVEEGDGDGLLNPGESTAFTITLRSRGIEPVVDAVGQLTCSDAAVTVLEGNVAYGTLAPGQSSSGSGVFRVRLAAGTPTPRILPLSLTVTGAKGGPWTFPVTCTYVTSATIAGQVRRVSGVPVPGAVVSWTGTTTGQTVAAVDGTYSLRVSDGAYTITARAAGYLDSTPTTVTTPPSRTVNPVLSFVDVAVTPTALSLSVEQGQTASANLTVANGGDSPLTWTAGTQAGSPSSVTYQVTTSDQAGGPAFVWNDIAATGTRVTGLSDDSNVGPFPIGFSMPFYGQSFTSLRICSNGWVSFTSTRDDYNGMRLPSTSAPANLIAALWRDLDPSWDGTVHYQQVDPGTFVVQFTGIPSLRNINVFCTFQIVLQANGTILLYYRSTQDPYDATVGLQNAVGTEGLTIAYNQAFLHAGLAVRIQPVVTWLSVHPASGVTAPGGAATSVVSGNAQALAPGLYQAVIGIASNDLATPQVNVPVALQVTAAPMLTFGTPVVNDDATAPSTGDSDGQAEPGETVELRVPLSNVGMLAANGIQATLATTSPYASVTTASVGYGNIAAGATNQPLTPFVLAIAANCPDNTSIPFSLVTSDGAGRVWTSTLAVVVRWSYYLKGTIRDHGSKAVLGGVVVSVASLSTTTAADGTFTINDVPAGTFNAVASKTGYATANRSFTFPTNRTWNAQIGTRNLTVAPTALAIEVQPGKTGTGTIALASTGTLPVTWTASAFNSGADYQMATSDQAGGPAFVWNDIAATGTLVTGLMGNNVGPFPIGFPMPFYGQSFTTLRVCSRGWVSFTSTVSNQWNRRLPDPSAPENLIAALWRDLYPGAGGTVHYQQVGSGTFVIQFTNVPRYNSTSSLCTFQIVLKSDGSVLLYYQRTDDPLVATVGIQNAAGTLGITAVNNQAFLHAGLAVRFQQVATWLNVAPTAGTTAAGATANVVATVNAAGMASGVYTSTVTITSNDLDMPVQTVPVTLTVASAQAPVAAPVTAAGDEDQAIPVTLLGSDADGDALTYALVTPPAHGTLTGSGAARIYTPFANWNGTETFTYRASDGYRQSNIATITVTIAPMNDAPVMVDRVVRVAQGGSIQTALVATDVDGDALVFTVTTLPLHGQVGQVGDTISYQPDLSFLGDDPITVAVSDGAISVAATITFQVVQPSRDWPTLGNGPDHVGLVLEAVGLDEVMTPLWSVAFDQQINQVAVGDGRIFVTPVTRFANSYLAALNLDTGVEEWRHIFAQAYSVNPPTFSEGSVYVQRGNDYSDTQLYRLSANDGSIVWQAPHEEQQWERYLAPTVVGDRVWISGGYFGGMYGFNRHTGAQIAFLDMQQYDQWTPTAANGQLYTWAGTQFAVHNPVTGAIQWSLTTSDGDSALSMNSAVVADGRRAYLFDHNTYPTRTLMAVDLVERRIVWSLTDNLFRGLPALHEGSLFMYGTGGVKEIGAVDGALIRTYAMPDGLATSLQPIIAPNAVIASGVSSTHVFMRGDSVARHTIPVGGHLSLAGSRLLIASGTTLHAYRMPNRAPRLVSAVVAIMEDASGEHRLQALDPDGDALSFAITGVPVHGTAEIIEGNRLRFVPAADFHGDEMIQVTVDDGMGGITANYITFLVAPVNDAPVADAKAVAMAANGTATITLSAADVDGDAVSFRLVAPAMHGTAIMAGSILSYTPAVGWSGVEMLQVVANDGQTDSVPAPVTVTVAPALPAPWVARDIGATAPAGSSTHAIGTFTLRGAGADIWNKADAFHFMSQPMTGDCTIIARVLTVPNAHPWSKAGVMIRESLDAGSRHGMLVISPGNGASFQRRLTTNGASTGTTQGGYAAPYWVCLVRLGTSITAFRSVDGLTWEQVGSDTVAMTASVEIGLVVTSHVNGTLGTATFDNVSVINLNNVAPVVSAGSDLAITLPASASLDATVTDDGLPTASSVSQLWTTVSGPGTVTFANASAVDTTASFSVAGTYVLRLTANDTLLSTSDDVTVVVAAVVPPTAVAINAGGGASGIFAADSGFSGGVSYRTSNPVVTAGVANAAPESVYQSERRGNCTYTIGGLVPGAAQTVRLHFAELWFTAPGKRIFDVAINGTIVLANFDVVLAAGGANKALVREFAVTASSTGTITITLISKVNNAKINGIEVLSVVAPAANG